MSPVAYAKLTIDEQSLLLPQDRLLHIELASNIQANISRGNITLGFVEFDEHEWPVITLDNNLMPLTSLPEQRRLVACIDGTEQPLALACDTITTLPITAESIFEPLPEIMRHEKSPIEALLHSQGILHFLLNTDALIRLLPHRETEE